jgi:hypothetical protein
MFISASAPYSLEGTLRYLNDEQSFAFDVASPDDLLANLGSDEMTSVSVGTLQIEVSVPTGIVLFVWGFHPRATWREARLATPRAVPGSLRIDAGHDLRRGVSLRLAPPGAWATCFDDTTGWVRIAESEAGRGYYVEVARGVVLGLANGELESLWLQPVFE